MEANTISAESYIDIVFKNRNQQYGGYELRKNYSQRMLKGVTFVVVAATGLAWLSFSKNADALKQQVPKAAEHGIIIAAIELPKPKIPQPRLAENKPPAAAKSVVNSIPKIVANELAAPKEVGPARPVVNNGVGKVDSLPVEGYGTHGGTPGKTEEAPAPSPKPIVFCEQMPCFNGDINQYFAAHLHYPEAAKAAGAAGRVAVKFVVNEDGSISDVELARGIGYGCDEEALKVIKGMPKWKPGKNNGHAVKVLYTMPITFTLE